jgi:hypothetical protein
MIRRRARERQHRDRNRPACAAATAGRLPTFHPPGQACEERVRATGITTYLENGGTLEHAQRIAAHESPRTTKVYDRASDQITLDEIERIANLGNWIPTTSRC